MPSPRSRSSSPRRDERTRSRSPRRRRDDDRSKRGGGGFRWKEKRRNEDGRDGEGERRLERGYRDRDRPRSPVRDIVPVVPPVEKPKKEKKEKKAAPLAAPTGEPMIIVNVNDRLGTKAAIPCLASDPISTSCGIAQIHVHLRKLKSCRAFQGTGSRQNRSTTS